MCWGIPAIDWGESKPGAGRTRVLVTRRAVAMGFVPGSGALRPRFLGRSGACQRCECPRSARRSVRVGTEVLGAETRTSARSEPRVELVNIYDTTLRDGSQGEGISLSVEDKLRIAARLDEFGMAYIEGGWPGSNPKDAEFFHAMRQTPLQTAKLVAFGSTRYKGVRCEDDANVKALMEAETPVVTLVGKAWDMQVEVVLGTDLSENLAMISDTVAFFKEKGREVMLDAEHFFDGYRANRAYALKCLTAAEQAGVDVVVLCDTNGGSTPWDVAQIVSDVASNVSCRIGIHTHNDMELAVANSIAAVRAGATVVQGTANGYGERTGNANLMSIIPTLELKMGTPCLPEGKLAGLTALSRFIDEQANMPHENSRPFVGNSAFAHKGGLHVAAVMKNADTYQTIDPEAVGNQKRVLISELSGRGNIVNKAQELGLLKPGEVVDNAWKGRSKAILTQIKDLENKGYTFEGAEASVELMIRRSLPGYVPPFELLDFYVISSNKRVEEPSNGIKFSESGSQATVKMCVMTECADADACPFLTLLEAAEGNGPVNALNNAMMKALRAGYPSVGNIALIDYKVRILDNESATEATTRVMIEFEDHELKRTWSSVSAHPNIIVASVNALMDGYEYGMVLRTGSSPPPE